MRLKNILLIFLAFISLTMFTGCIDIVEEIFLKKNGSGKYTMRMDMSGVLDMVAMMGAMGEQGNETDDFFDEIGGEMDSTFYFKDADPEMKKEFTGNPDLWNRVNLRMHANKEDKKLLMEFNLDFENMDDVQYFLKDINQMMAAMDNTEEGGENPADIFGGIGGGSFLWGQGEQRRFDYKAKKRTLMRYDTSEEDIRAMKENLSEEENQMATMMFANSTYTTIYHLPGKVKKMTNPRATLSADQKTVTTKVKFMDYMQGKLKLDNTIKFK